MTKKKKPDVMITPDHPLAKLADQMGGDDLKILFANNLVDPALINIMDSKGYEGRQKQLDNTVALITAVDPQNRLEGLLASQMAGIHSLMMQTTGRAYQSDYEESADRYINQTVKLSRVYLEQIAALDKMRGKAGQKIVVEKVNIEAGGQAAIGVYEGGGVNNEKPEQSPSADAEKR